jgi:hypothetical protein
MIKPVDSPGYECMTFSQTSPCVPFKKSKQNYGKSPFLIGKSTISTGAFSIAMLNYHRVPNPSTLDRSEAK